MKLMIPQMTLSEWLLEFDFWITSSLSEIKDNEAFKTELELTAELIELLGEATNDFDKIENISLDKICQFIVLKIKGATKEYTVSLLNNLASFFFLITGKSDNSLKCQLPIYLKNTIESMPFREIDGKIEYKEIPRVLPTKRYMNIICCIRREEGIAYKLLFQYVNFVLSDEEYLSQLWSIGHGYFALEQYGKGKDLISPIIVFKIRGSVTAKAGHEPEEILRQIMGEWGLQANYDFNIMDVSLSELLAEKDKRQNGDIKDRKYDFVLPYKVNEWDPQLFIQCQFYAGDSGSVSHKNLDQAISTRLKTSEKIKSAKYIEYVDGAGYYASLNGDLKKLIQDAYMFFQIKSSAIKLRFALQQIGFITPIEIEHSIARSDGSILEVCEVLRAEGYSNTEINRSIRNAIERNIVVCKGDRLQIIEDRKALVRRYFVLDTIAQYGEKPKDKDLKGFVLIPGFGTFFGMAITSIAKKVKEISPPIYSEWTEPITCLDDLQWLSSRGYIKLE